MDKLLQYPVSLIKAELEKNRSLFFENEITLIWKGEVRNGYPHAWREVNAFLHLFETRNNVSINEARIWWESYLTGSGYVMFLDDAFEQHGYVAGGVYLLNESFDNKAFGHIITFDVMENE